MLMGFELESYSNDEPNEEDLCNYGYYSEDENESYDSVVNNCRYLDHWYPDGSICGEMPVEWVTDPFEYDEWMNGGIDNVIECIEDCGYSIETDDSCGIHIHVQRTDVTHRMFYNAYKFIEEGYIFNEFVSIIAGRDDGNYHEAYGQYGNGVDTKENYKTGRCLHGHGARLAYRFNTIEFRIFQSVVDATRIKVYMQFVNALLEFGKVKNYKHDYKAFIDFVEADGSWKHLDTFIKGNIKQCVLQ